MIENGYCFKDAAGKELLVVQTGFFYGDESPAYICQELNGPHRVFVLREAEITMASDAEGPGLLRKAGAGSAVLEKTVGATYAKTDMEKMPKETTAVKAETEKEDDQPNEALIRFLDAEECNAKLAVINRLRDRISEPVLETMAMTMDFDLGEGSLSKKISAFESFLKTRAQYENKRRF